MGAVNVIEKPHVFKNVTIHGSRLPNTEIPGTKGTPGGGTLAVRAFNAQPKRLRFDLTGVTVTITDTGANGAHGSLKLMDLNEGLFVALGAKSDLDIVAAAGIDAAGAVVCGVGQAAVGTDNATLSSTEQDIIPSTSVTLSGSAGNFAGEASGVAFLNGADTAKDIYLNFAVSATDATANSTLTLTGWVDVFVLELGNED